MTKPNLEAIRKAIDTYRVADITGDYSNCEFEDQDDYVEYLMYQLDLCLNYIASLESVPKDG